MVAFTRVSPIAPLVRLGQPFAVEIGVAIAVAEIAIGIGALTGSAFRAAAVGGAALSILFFLTASWATRPFYYGPDLPLRGGLDHARPGRPWRRPRGGPPDRLGERPASRLRDGTGSRRPPRGPRGRGRGGRRLAARRAAARPADRPAGGRAGHPGPRRRVARDPLPFRCRRDDDRARCVRSRSRSRVRVGDGGGGWGVRVAGRRRVGVGPSGRRPRRRPRRRSRENRRASLHRAVHGPGAASGR